MSVACMMRAPTCHQGGSVPGVGKGAGGTGLTILVRAAKSTTGTGTGTGTGTVNKIPRLQYAVFGTCAGLSIELPPWLGIEWS